MELFLPLEMPRTGGFKVATLRTQVDQNIPKKKKKSKANSARASDTGK